ncbi:hypothetical protein BH09SUM1_BH09SUM1_00800 [soil metagenome]
MKNKVNAAVVVASVLALTAGVAIWSPVISQPAAAPSGKAMMQGKMMEGNMMEGCQAIMDEKKAVMADVVTQDAELTAHVAKMNSTAPADKQEVMAALLTHVVQQRVAMDVRMAKIEEEMMQHMMKHMMMGKNSMPQCPMMKDMKGMGNMNGMEGMEKK